MALEFKSNDVYGLITQLCERLVEKHCSIEDNPYLPQKDVSNITKKLRAKAFGVLLNKSNHGKKSNFQICSFMNELCSNLIFCILLYLSK